MPSEYRAYITSHEAGSPRSPDVSARKDHLVRCPECGEALDMRDLRKVLKHLHRGALEFVLDASGGFHAIA